MFGPGRAEAGTRPGRAWARAGPRPGGGWRWPILRCRRLGLTRDEPGRRPDAGREEPGTGGSSSARSCWLLSEVLIPSVLTRCDTPDLLIATHPRTVVLVNPANAMGQPEREAQMRGALWLALDTEKRLRTRDRIRIARRGFGDPVPTDQARVSKITTYWRRGARCSRRSRGRRDGSPATARTWRRFANRNASEVPAWRSGRASDSWPTSAAAPSCWG